MLSLHASAFLSITFYLSLINLVNLNSASDSDAGLCTPYPCNQPPSSSTGYSPYGTPPPPPAPPSSPEIPSGYPLYFPPPPPPPPKSPPRSHCPPVPPGCCNDQPPPSSTYSPPYPYFFTPPYPYGTPFGGEGGNGQGGVATTGAAMAYCSPSVPVDILMLVLSYAFVFF